MQNFETENFETENFENRDPVLLRVHALISGSRVNGPGNRMVIWTQGCGKGCRGCFNPETWARDCGKAWEPTELARHIFGIIDAMGLEGLTLTGGDPLEQPRELLAFFEALESYDPGLKMLPRGILMFTGYTMSELENLPGAYGAAARACVGHCDVIVDGRYEESLRIRDALAGSANQDFHFSSAPGRGLERIAESEVKTDQAVEVHVGETNFRHEGLIRVTGFPEHLRFRRRLRELGLVNVDEKSVNVDEFL